MTKTPKLPRNTFYAAWTAPVTATNAAQAVSGGGAALRQPLPASHSLRCPPPPVPRQTPHAWQVTPARQPCPPVQQTEIASRPGHHHVSPGHAMLVQADPAELHGHHPQAHPLAIYRPLSLAVARSASPPRPRTARQATTRPPPTGRARRRLAWPHTHREPHRITPFQTTEDHCHKRQNGRRCHKWPNRPCLRARPLSCSPSS